MPPWKRRRRVTAQIEDQGVQALSWCAFAQVRPRLGAGSNKLDAVRIW